MSSPRNAVRSGIVHEVHYNHSLQRPCIPQTACALVGNKKKKRDMRLQCLQLGTWEVSVCQFEAWG